MGFWGGFAQGLDQGIRESTAKKENKAAALAVASRRYGANKGSLLSLLDKRRAAEAPSQEDLQAYERLKHRVGDAEGGEEWLAKIPPKLASAYLATITAKEQEIGQVIHPSIFMSSLTTTGDANWDKNLDTINLITQEVNSAEHFDEQSSLQAYQAVREGILPSSATVVADWQELPPSKAQVEAADDVVKHRLAINGSNLEGSVGGDAGDIAKNIADYEPGGPNALAAKADAYLAPYTLGEIAREAVKAGDPSLAAPLSSPTWKGHGVYVGQIKTQEELERYKKTILPYREHFTGYFSTKQEDGSKVRQYYQIGADVETVLQEAPTYFIGR